MRLLRFRLFSEKKRGEGMRQNRRNKFVGEDKSTKQSRSSQVQGSSARYLQLYK